MKSVTVSSEPSGKYYASLLYEYRSENQTDIISYEQARILGIDYAMNGLAVFSDDISFDYHRYFRESQDTSTVIKKCGGVLVNTVIVSEAITNCYYEISV